MKTLIGILLDESGSMQSKMTETIVGYNSFLDEQKKIKEDKARLLFLKFNNTVSVVHSGIDLEKVPELNKTLYSPGGQTALYDAIAEGVRIMEKDKKDDERVICVIMTDGEENSSRETTKEQVKHLIKSHEDMQDWTFVYIGENPDRWAKETTTSPGNTVTYCHKWPQDNFSRASTACSSLRNSPLLRSGNLLNKYGRNATH